MALHLDEKHTVSSREMSDSIAINDDSVQIRVKVVKGSSHSSGFVAATIDASFLCAVMTTEFSGSNSDFDWGFLIGGDLP